MFVPAIYRSDDGAWQRRIMRDHPLATLVSNGEHVPYATRLPSLIRPGTTAGRPLIGAELIGHMNRANPHWASLTDGMRAGILFDGPGGYVTPAIYRIDPAAPTWDFISVHVHGRLKLITNREETLQVVRWTAQALEDRFGDNWDQASSIDYFRQIISGVGAFYLDIDSVDAMFKLSQEKAPEVQRSVIQRFMADGGGNGRQLAELMCDFGIGSSSAMDPARPRPDEEVSA
jgi:transcriptional regulator